MKWIFVQASVIMVSLFILIFVLYDRNDFEDKEPYVFSLFLAISVLSGATGINKIAQREEVIKLSPKYRAFLAETREFMHSDERKVFLGLDSDKERDYFIQKFWKKTSPFISRQNIYFLFRIF